MRYEFESRIRYSEVDSDGKLSLESLLDYFQDCSTFHSEDVGVGIKYLKEKHMAWVLAAWQIVVERYPKLCENVVIGTAPYEFKAFLGFRNFQMKTKQGEQLACANTIWTLMDMNTMRPIKPTEDMLQAYILEEKLPMTYEPRRIPIPEGNGIKQPPVEIRRHHLDTNQHVNNGQYIRIAGEYLPKEFKIAQMRAEYKRQAMLADVIYPVLYETDEHKWTIALNDADGKPYCITEFRREHNPQ